jgi:hypothetical protein
MVDTASPPKNNEPPRTPKADKLPQEQPLSVLSPPGLASIIVPCCGQLEYTKLCVASLLRHTRKNHELIFLDIGSLDGTVEYLTGIATAAPLRVEIVRTQTDLGIPQAVQNAVRLARGDFGWRPQVDRRGDLGQGPVQPPGHPGFRAAG